MSLSNKPSVQLSTLLGGKKSIVAGTSNLKLADYAREIVGSGFPAIRLLTPRLQRAQLDGYIERIVERDFLDQGQKVRNKAALPTRNRLRRLGASPVHQLADPALAARLLGIDAQGLVDTASDESPVPRSGPLLGPLFESLGTLSVRTYAQANEARVYHLRTRGGEREIDLIIERGDGKIVALEVKLSTTVNDRDTRHLHWLADAIDDDLLDSAILTTGSEAYRRRDGIAVIPASLLTA